MAGQSKKRKKGSTRNPSIPKDPKGEQKIAGGPYSQKKGQFRLHQGRKSKVASTTKGGRGPMKSLEGLNRKRAVKKSLKWPD